MISLPSVICNMFASATPIALAGVGGMFGERSGITNIGLDGTMLFAAFTAVTACYYTGSPWIALLAGILSGVLYRSCMHTSASASRWIRPSSAWR